MKRAIFLTLFFISSSFVFAQKWVDTLYSIQTLTDVTYGSATDFAGNERTLQLDISFPVGDTIPICGRPLMMLIHGGAFITGDKGDNGVKRLRQDFAKRGYVTASVRYRLGLFQTHQAVNCNISGLGAEWNCLNMADTSEWYRAYFRGVQDVNGAIRFLVNHATDYDLDPQNIFVVGESAGGFIAMGVGFIDDQAEVMASLTGTRPDVQAPNSLYEMACVQGYGLDTAINSMALTRLDLGSYEGSLNFPATKPYRIRGVGNFFGAVFNNIFGTTNQQPPALYTFHQPNDLLVPFNHNRIFGGYAHCATQWPFSCQYIINRPLVYGSNGIKTLLDEMNAQQQLTPDFLFEKTNNNAPCAIQIANPALSGHGVDNYWLRTGNMAAFFAAKIDSCTATGLSDKLVPKRRFSLYPNPLDQHGFLTIKGDFRQHDRIIFADMTGKQIIAESLKRKRNEVRLDLNSSKLAPGLYFVQIYHQEGRTVKKVILR